jgi:hypothetical protein
MKKLLFSTVKGSNARNIQVVDIASGVVTTLVDSSPTSYDSAPAWSPDGKQIAFESTMDGDREIYVMNADGSNIRQLTHNTLWDEGPAWSPDGTKLAFSSGADDAHLDIWTMNVDGSDPRQLTTYPGRDESPDWGVNPHPAPVGGSVPATLSLTLGAPPSFGAFQAGVARDYTASATATVTSSAGDAGLVVQDASPQFTNHLVNGAFALPSTLQASAASALGTGSGPADVGGADSPTPLLHYAGPVSNDAITVSFKQHIGSTDALRTGGYAKTLTFTLSTTNP